MAREWKPGDVALVTWENASGSQRADGISRIKTARGLCADGFWNFGRSSRIPMDSDTIRDIRPLVVIDPEGRDQVERLLQAYWDTNVDGGFTDQAELITAMQAALRSLTEPPRPPEPTGLGAVVEDGGEEFVHFGNGCWIKSVPNATLRQKNWAAFTDAVRVLSEGVQS